MARLSSSQLRLGGGLVVAAVLLVYTLNSGQQPAPTIEKHKPRMRTTVVAQQDAGQQAAAPLRWAAPSDADFGRYEPIAARDIFSPPKPKVEKPKPVRPAPPPLVPPIGPRLGIRGPNGELIDTRPPAPRPAPPPTLTGWTYVGYLTINGTTRAILQSDSSDTVQSPEVGTDFQGFHVVSADGEEAVLTAGGGRTTLKRTKDFPILPLGKSAAATPRAIRGPMGQ